MLQKLVSWGASDRTRRNLAETASSIERILTHNPTRFFSDQLADWRAALDGGHRAAGGVELAIRIRHTGIRLHRGMLFTIVEPDREEQFGDLTIAIPGRPVAYAKVQEVSETGNRSLVLRRWGEIRQGYAAREHIAPLWSLQLDARPGNNGVGTNNMGLGVRFHALALQRFDLGVGLGYTSTFDSRDDMDPGIEFGVMAGTRYRLSPAAALFTRVELAFSPFFRTDDTGHVVNAGVGFIALGADLELLRSQGKDLVVGVAWRFGGSSDDWSYSKGDEDNRETFPAYWDERGAPTVDISGVFFTVGLRFIFSGVRLPGLPNPGL